MKFFVLHQSLFQTKNKWMPQLFSKDLVLLKSSLKIQYVCKVGWLGLRLWPPPFCVKSAGRPKPGALRPAIQGTLLCPTKKWTSQEHWTWLFVCCRRKEDTALRTPPATSTWVPCRMDSPRPVISRTTDALTLRYALDSLSMKAHVPTCIAASKIPFMGAVGERGWFFLSQCSSGELNCEAQSTLDASTQMERKTFDVACVQCEHSHSRQQVPFACGALRCASTVDWALCSI